MKISTFLATGLGVFLLAGAANAATVKYVATLTGAQSLNLTTSTATATATLDYDDVAKTLTGTIVYPGDTGTGFTIVPSGGHLKSGECTESGSIISALTVETGATAASGVLSLNNSTPLDDDQIAALSTGGLFLTIENTTYPSPESEIRGQIVADGAANDFCAAAIAALPTATVDGGTDSGATATVDAGPDTTTPTTTTTTVDDSGCNTSGSSSPGSSAALALGLGLALYGMARKRKQA